jgi:hypothetical protein
MLIRATALYKGLSMCCKVETAKKEHSLHLTVCCIYRVLAVVTSQKGAGGGALLIKLVIQVTTQEQRAAMIRVFRHESLQQWRMSMHPCWRVCGKNLNIVSVCAVSPVVHTSSISRCQKKLFPVLLWLWTTLRFVLWFSYYKCLKSRRTLWNILCIGLLSSATTHSPWLQLIVCFCLPFSLNNGARDRASVVSLRRFST